MDEESIKEEDCKRCIEDDRFRIYQVRGFSLTLYFMEMSWSMFIFLFMVELKRGDHKVFLTGILAASSRPERHLAGLRLLQKPERE